MSKMNSQIQAALNELDSLGWWYQHFRLPNGLWTGDGKEPAYLPEQRWELIQSFVPQDLSGKTVLDLGGNAGFFSIQMRLRGAARCVLVEPYREFLQQAQFAARQFGVTIETIAQDAHVYCLTTTERFDYVLLLGLLYHLKYPGLVLDRVAEMTKELAYIASLVIGPEVESNRNDHGYDQHTPDDLLADVAFPKLVFLEDSYNNDSTNWWIPNYSGLAAMVRSAGLRPIARPHPHILIAGPEHYFGKFVSGSLVFPRYAKKGFAPQPGDENVPRKLWSDLSARAVEFRDHQRKQCNELDDL